LGSAENVIVPHAFTKRRQAMNEQLTPQAQLALDTYIDARKLSAREIVLEAIVWLIISVMMSFSFWVEFIYKADGSLKYLPDVIRNTSTSFLVHYLPSRFQSCSDKSSESYRLWRCGSRYPHAAQNSPSMFATGLFELARSVCATRHRSPAHSEQVFL
jgi:hypothetical protein